MATALLLRRMTELQTVSFWVATFAVRSLDDLVAQVIGIAVGQQQYFGRGHSAALSGAFGPP